MPRPETEIVVERALALIARASRRRGSSTSARAAVRSRSRSPTSIPGAVVTATDVSPTRSRSRARTPSGSASRSSSSRRTSSTASPARSTSSSRTRRTSRPASCPASSRRCATGSRGSRLSTGARPRRSPGPRDRLAPGRCDRPRMPRGARRGGRGAARRARLPRGYDHAGISQAESEWWRGDGRRRGDERAIEAIRAGQAVLLPTDGVYGLCASAYREAPVRRLYELKGRDESEPSAIIASSVDMLFECVPELRGRAGRDRPGAPAGPVHAGPAEPGPPLPLAERRAPGHDRRPVVDLPVEAQRVLDAVGAVVATSANDPGGPPRRASTRCPLGSATAVAAEIDAGRLSGTPSTVIDFSGPSPSCSARGAGSVADALARVGDALVRC